MMSPRGEFAGGGGQGQGGGRGQGGRGRGLGRGGGRGMGRGGRALGPGGDCICPNCGATVKHQLGVPCIERDCPQCGQKMTRP